MFSHLTLIDYVHEDEILYVQILDIPANIFTKFGFYISSLQNISTGLNFEVMYDT
jgi:hypothetical protein